MRCAYWCLFVKQLEIRVRFSIRVRYRVRDRGRFRIRVKVWIVIAPFALRRIGLQKAVKT